MSRRRLIPLVVVIAFALANILHAAAGDRAGHIYARTGAPTIAVALASITHAIPPRFKDSDQAWTLGHALVDPALSTARLTPSRAGRGHGARASCLELLRRAPAGCRPPPQR